MADSERGGWKRGGENRVRRNENQKELKGKKRGIFVFINFVCLVSALLQKEL